ncbi:hypothetical protein [Streptomyces sp. NPDC004721]
MKLTFRQTRNPARTGLRRETWMAIVTDGQSRSPDPGPARTRTRAAVLTQGAAPLRPKEDR